MNWYLRTGVTILAGIVSVLIVLAVLEEATTGFEKAVVSGLLLLYASLNFRMAALVRWMKEEQKAQYARFLELRAALGAPAKEIERESFDALLQHLEGSRTGFSISLIVNGAISVLALITLGAAMLD